MRLTGAHLKGLKWHLLKQNGSGKLNMCTTSDPLPVICINKSTIYAHNANRLKTIYTLLDAKVQVPKQIFDCHLDDIQEWMTILSTQSFQDAIEMLIQAAQDNTVPDFDDISEEDLKAAAESNGT